MHETFVTLRRQNLAMLKQLNLTEAHFKLKGTHPDFGPVTLEQLLATWVVHDFDHISQIARVMAKQYVDEVGPWVRYLSILKRK